jgi:hypothetical protein
VAATSRPAGAHIVGRFPLDGPEDVFRTISERAGPLFFSRGEEATSGGAVCVIDGAGRMPPAEQADNVVRLVIAPSPLSRARRLTDTPGDLGTHIGISLHETTGGPSASGTRRQALGRAHPCRRASLRARVQGRVDVRHARFLDGAGKNLSQAQMSNPRQ